MRIIVEHKPRFTSHKWDMVKDEGATQYFLSADGSAKMYHEVLRDHSNKIDWEWLIKDDS